MYSYIYIQCIVVHLIDENMVTKGSIGDSGGSSSAGLIGGIVGGVTVLMIALVITVLLLIIYKMVANRNSGSFSPDLEKVSHTLFEA